MDNIQIKHSIEKIIDWIVTNNISVAKLQNPIINQVFFNNDIEALSKFELEKLIEIIKNCSDFDLDKQMTSELLIEIKTKVILSLDKEDVIDKNYIIFEMPIEKIKRMILLHQIYKNTRLDTNCSFVSKENGLFECILVKCELQKYKDNAIILPDLCINNYKTLINSISKFKDNVLPIIVKLKKESDIS